MARTHEEIISFPQGGMVKSCAALLFYRSMVCFSPSCPDAFFRRSIDFPLAQILPTDRFVKTRISILMRSFFRKLYGKILLMFDPYRRDSPDPSFSYFLYAFENRLVIQGLYRT